MPAQESTRTAFRSELRDSPRRRARSGSRGSRSPGWSSPETIISLIFAIASSVTLTGTTLRPERGVLQRERTAHDRRWAPSSLGSGAADVPWMTGVERYARRLIEAFGPRRVMWESDWPVCTLAASYAGALELG